LTLAELRRSHMTVMGWYEPLRRARGPKVRAESRGVGDRVLATLREWRRRARDRAQLAELDDRMLKDIGLTRTDAEFLINKPFWRE
jgi:uncharacterized protein YjiS (DUF1127 family)